MLSLVRRSIPSKFSKIFRTTAGAKFWGELSFADEEGENGFLAPRRFLTVSRKSTAVAGSVIVAPTGDRFILGSHVNYDFVTTFKAYSVDRAAVWTRATKVIDTSTGLEREGVPFPMGTLWITLEPIRQVKDFEISEDILRFVTGQAVQEGDLIDGKRIIRVLDQIGLKVCEVG